MTQEEAQKVAEIRSTADGHCQVCVGNLCDLLQEAFPSFQWEEMAAAVEEEYAK